MANGTIDTSTLTPVPGQPALRLTAAASASWGRLVAAVLATFGWVVTLTDAYRDYATQERIFRQRYTPTYLPGRPRKWWLGRWWYLKAGYATAAVPGTSNHGLGITVDVANLGGFAGVKYLQFATLAPAHGWNNREGRSIGEFWHWTHVTTDDAHHVSNPIGGGTGSAPDVGVTIPTPITPEDDMYDDAAEQRLMARLAAMQAETGRIGTRLRDIEAADKYVRTWFADYLGRKPKQSELDERVLMVVRNTRTLDQQKADIKGSPEATEFAALPPATKTARIEAAKA